VTPSPAQTHVLMALLRVYDRHGRATIRDVADEAGLSLSRTHSALGRLKLAGFVAWEPGRAGTLRPLVEEVGP
jgi:DNA-binding MarR family transcriptional regulator